MGADEVDGHQAGELLAVLAAAAAAGAADQRRAAARRVGADAAARAERALLDAADAAGIARRRSGKRTLASGRDQPAGQRRRSEMHARRVELARLAGDGREAAQQGHELLVGGGVHARPRRGAARRRLAVADAVDGRRATGRECGREGTPVRGEQVHLAVAAGDRIDLAIGAAARRDAPVAQALVAGIGAAHLVARTFDRAHRQGHRPNATLLEHLQDVLVALRHRMGHRGAELAREQASALALARDRFDAAVQRRADDLGPDRVALVVGPADAEERAGVRRELAQLPLALVRDQLAEAHEVHLLLDLLLADEAEGLPVGRLELSLVVDARLELLGDLLSQRFEERVLERAEVPAQFLLRDDDLVALRDLGRVLGQDREVLGHVRRRRRRRRADQTHGRVERGLGARVDRIHQGVGPTSAANSSKTGEDVPSMSPKVAPPPGTASRSGRARGPCPRRVSGAANRGSRAAGRPLPGSAE